MWWRQNLRQFPWLEHAIECFKNKKRLIKIKKTKWKLLENLQGKTNEKKRNKETTNKTIVEENKEQILDNLDTEKINQEIVDSKKNTIKDAS